MCQEEHRDFVHGSGERERELIYLRPLDDQLRVPHTEPRRRCDFDNAINHWMDVPFREDQQPLYALQEASTYWESWISLLQVSSGPHPYVRRLPGHRISAYSPQIF
jgi:hypothetical protein